MSHTVVRARRRITAGKVSLRGINQTTVTGASVSSVTCPVPTEALAGDLLVAIISWRRGSSAPSVASPTTWTDILTQTGSNITQLASWKFMDGDTSVRFAGPSIAAASGAIVNIAALSGVDPASPILDSCLTNVAATGTVVDFPAMAQSAAGAGYYAQAAVVSDASSRTMTWAAPMIEQSDVVVASGSARSLGASSAFGNSSSSFTERVTLSSTQTYRLGIMVAARPAP